MRRREHFEEILAFSLRKHGHPFAVGRPGETLPPALGATRLYYPDNQWQAAVRQIADDASLVAVVVGRSQWLTWGDGSSAPGGPASQDDLCSAAGGPREAAKRLAVLREVLGVPWSLFETRGTGRDAAENRRVLAAWALVTAGGRIRSGRDDLEADLAIDCCAEALANPMTVDRDEPEAADPSTALDDRGAAPRAEVLAAGESRAIRRWWRRPWVLVLLVSGLVAPFVQAVGKWCAARRRERSSTRTHRAPSPRSSPWSRGGVTAYLREGDTAVRRPMAGDGDDPAVELGRLPGRALSASWQTACCTPRYRSMARLTTNWSP